MTALVQTPRISCLGQHAMTAWRTHIKRHIKSRIKLVVHQGCCAACCVEEAHSSASPRASTLQRQASLRAKQAEAGLQTRAGRTHRHRCSRLAATALATLEKHPRDRVSICCTTSGVPRSRPANRTAHADTTIVNSDCTLWRFSRCAHARRHVHLHHACPLRR